MTDILRRLLQNFSKRAKGVEVVIDPDLGTSELIAFALRFVGPFARGILRGRALVSLESGVAMRNRHRIRIGKFSKIGKGTLIEGLSRDGVNIGEGVTLGRYGRIRATANLGKLGKGVKIDPYVGMGDFFYLGAFGGIEIGSETIIGERLTIHSDNHDFDDITTAIRRQSTTEMPVRIGRRCWLGSNITILGGVDIGDDCVIGAGAVVTRSFPAGSIIVGNPARRIRDRFGAPDRKTDSPKSTS